MQGKQTGRAVNNVMMVLDVFSNIGINVVSSKQMTKGHGSRLRHSCQSLTGKLTGKRVWAIKPAKEMTEGHVANVQGFKLMKVVTLMLGYGATKFDRLKDGATMLALTSNYSLRIPSSLVKIFDTDAGGSKPIAITFSSRIHGRDFCCEWQVNH
ncbi:hypothetical protein NC652_040635 [Populus alba x Populus x berolinensis]|nr:hypothetical protein NC652_040635 [Populus alba x Populus x berolinensis]